jgi:hypothetical protein
VVQRTLRTMKPKECLPVLSHKLYIFFF